MPYLPNSDSCFGCGRKNPLGLRVRFLAEDEQVMTTFMATPDHCGFKDVVHGGVLAALLDETMGWAPCYLRKRFAYAAEIRIRYVQPAPPAQLLTIRGWLSADRGRVWETEGEIRGPNGQLYARGFGKYMPFSAEQTREVMDYLHFGPDTLSRSELEP